MMQASANFSWIWESYNTTIIFQAKRMFAKSITIKETEQ